MVAPFGFTLVELLVVIGIIALLISILLPALNKARQAAQRTACSAKLHSILLAANTHRIDHRGFYPLVGTLPGDSPDTLDDTYATKYDYFPPSTNTAHAIVPEGIDMALAKDLGFKKLDANNPNQAKLIAEAGDPTGYSRNFWCPSQATTIQDFGPGDGPYLYYGTSPGGHGSVQSDLSYVFNETVMGWGFTDTFNRLHGNSSLIRQPAATLFACDGLQGSASRSEISVSLPCGFLTVYNISPNPPVTLADAYLGTATQNGSGGNLAGDPANFDLKRHQGKINIAFCDGHVETRTISVGDLRNVFLMAP
jgi:prepilin-type processing-associated H-X9-DG protein/prepilin-type N-terminal cleavage/methylation domain-containing protein